MRLAIVVLLNLLSYTLMSQEYSHKDIDLNKVADELYGSRDLDLNYEELYENLVQLLSHPLNLNKASEEDLRFLNVLSESQIKKLIDYRKENGNLISVYELQAIPEFDLQTILELVPFVKVVDPAASINASLWARVKTESDNYFFTTKASARFFPSATCVGVNLLSVGMLSRLSTAFSSPCAAARMYHL